MTINGIDVSNYQGNFDWEAWRGKIGFAFAKVTEGVTFADPYAAANLAGMASIGVVRGGYHFLRAGVSGTEQATFFMLHAKAAGLGPGDLVAVDVEQSGIDGRTPAQVDAVTAEFVAVIHAALGTCIVYTDISMATGGYLTSPLGSCPLWLADPSGMPPLPVGPWRSAAFEQTGQSGVDLDVFHGDAAALAALAIPHPGGNVTDIPLDIRGSYTDAKGDLFVIGVRADGVLCESKRTAIGTWTAPYPIAGKTGAS